MNRSKRGHASGYNSGRSFLEFDSFAMPRDPHPEQRPLRELYCRLMEELKRRRNIIADVLDSSDHAAWILLVSLLKTPSI
jgi:hypothetical protein